MKLQFLTLLLVGVILGSAMSLQTRQNKMSLHRLRRSMSPLALADSYENFYRNYGPQIFGDLQYADKRAAMGVDLPDYILHYNGKTPNIGSYREKMQKSG